MAESPSRTALDLSGGPNPILFLRTGTGAPEAEFELCGASSVLLGISSSSQRPPAHDEHNTHHTMGRRA